MSGFDVNGDCWDGPTPADIARLRSIDVWGDIPDIDMPDGGKLKEQLILIYQNLEICQTEWNRTWQNRMSSAVLWSIMTHHTQLSYQGKVTDSVTTRSGGGRMETMDKSDNIGTRKNTSISGIRKDSVEARQDPMPGPIGGHMSVKTNQDSTKGEETDTTTADSATDSGHHVLDVQEKTDTVTMRPASNSDWMKDPAVVQAVRAVLDSPRPFFRTVW